MDGSPSSEDLEFDARLSKRFSVPALRQRMNASGMRRKSTTVVGGHRIIGGHRPWRDSDFLPALSARLSNRDFLPALSTRLSRRASTWTGAQPAGDSLDVANVPAPNIRVGRNLGQRSESSCAIEDAAPIPPIPLSSIAGVELLKQARDAAAESLGQLSEVGHAVWQRSEPTVTGHYTPGPVHPDTSMLLS